MENLAELAIKNAMEGKLVYCKFLSANDAGKTGGHQCGVLVSTNAKQLLFEQNLENESILKRTAEIKWQNDMVIQNHITWYKSKKELRITNFGKSFPYLNPEMTGALFVLVQYNYDYYTAYLLNTDDEINQFLDSFGISPTETNKIIEKSNAKLEIQEQQAIDEFLKLTKGNFPSSEEMSNQARSIWNRLHARENAPGVNADRKIVDWTEEEFKLFRALEHANYEELISKGFANVDDFIAIANEVLNRRKSRAGKSLEHHLAALFDENKLQYTAQAITEGNKRPDFIFPSESAYHDMSFSVDGLISLAAKTTCKDRWRQVINESDRLRDRTKYLCTLQQGVSEQQMDEMTIENVTLVVPSAYIRSFPHDKQGCIWTIDRFIEFVKSKESHGY